MVRPPSPGPTRMPLLASTRTSLIPAGTLNGIADKPAIPFKIPAGIKLIRVDSKTGLRAGPGDSGKTILEAFKPGTAPSDNYAAIGVADTDERGSQPSPDGDRSLFRPGTGGLY